MSDTEQSLQALVADVAAAYFESSHVAPSDIPNVIRQIAESLGSVGDTQAAAPAEVTGPAKMTRAQIRKSITPEALVSFEDGKLYRTLRRHLSVKGLTPDAYREKWGLPADYPITAPSYSAARSALAKQLGLGQRGQQARKRSGNGRKRAIKS